MKTSVINTKSILPNSFRFDPSFHLSEAIILGKDLDNVPYEKISIKDTNSKVFLGNIFSRIFVKDKEHGIPYLAASDTVLADINTGRFLSKKQSKELAYLILKKDWIVITCSGTIGNVTYTNSTFENHIATHDLIRIVPNDEKILKGYLYAFLSSKYGYNQLTQSRFGGVVKHINADHVNGITLPLFPESFQMEVDDLIQESARLREEATEALEDASKLLKHYASLSDLTEADYDYYGPRSYERQVSCFVKSRKDIDSTTINAFNHSERIKNTKDKITCLTRPLKDLIINGDVFSTGSFPRIEVKEDKHIMLINQSDIFDTIIRGKHISKRNVKLSNLVEYGEVLIAGVGTLGENETFCRCIYANEDLVNQLVSGEFIRMKTIEKIPSGYLYTWLSSDYGFRFIRNLQTGTKLCRPIPRLLLEIPVPIIESNKMKEIHDIVTDAHTKRYKANCLVKQAIGMIENEIEHWNK